MATLWRVRITRARDRGQFTDKDRDDAGEWYSCAVGERSKGNRDEPQYPGVVYVAGIAFSDAVHKDNFDEAERQRKIILKEMKAA